MCYYANLVNKLIAKSASFTKPILAIATIYGYSACSRHCAGLLHSLSDLDLHNNLTLPTVLTFHTLGGEAPGQMGAEGAELGSQDGPPRVVSVAKACHSGQPVSLIPNTQI